MLHELAPRRSGCAGREPSPALKELAEGGVGAAPHAAAIRVAGAPTNAAHDFQTVHIAAKGHSDGNKGHTLVSRRPFIDLLVGQKRFKPFLG